MKSSSIISYPILSNLIYFYPTLFILLANQGFAKDIGMTVWRVLGGFALAALLAIPLGVAMGVLNKLQVLGSST